MSSSSASSSTSTTTTIKIDGACGSETEAAVKAVQRCSGIKVDGQVGPEAWKYLDYPRAGYGRLHGKGRSRGRPRERGQPGRQVVISSIWIASAPRASFSGG
ncbi:peptidoglycan-binding domain-containing protein [Streptomyces sp. NPDC054975]